jgi:hypothetical protein
LRGGFGGGFDRVGRHRARLISTKVTFGGYPLHMLSSLKFETWRADLGLRKCSLAARGLWIDMMALMQEATPYGHLTEDGEAMPDRRLAALVGRPLREIRNALDELERHRVFSRTDDGVIYSQRMVRDHAKSLKCSEAGKAGVEAKASRNSKGDRPGSPMQGVDEGRPEGSEAPIPASKGNNTSDMAKQAAGSVHHHVPGREAGPTRLEPQAGAHASATLVLPRTDPDLAEWKPLKDQIAGLYARFGLMADIGTVDVWQLQGNLDPKLIWPLIGRCLEERLRLNPMTSLRQFTSMVTREAVRRDSSRGAAAATTGGPGKPAVAPSRTSVLTPVKSSPPDRYLKTPKGITAAEQIPPEDWIILARQWNDYGVWPPTLGPPPGKPGSSCPPEFAKKAS